MAAGIVLLASAISARGQGSQFETMEPDQDVMRQNRGPVFTLISSPTPAPLSADDRRLLTDYLTKYQFPLFSQTDELSIGKLHEERNRFQSQFLWGPANGPVRQAINQIVFAEAQKLISGNFHPAVKYNAVLLLGSIDERKSDVVSANAKSVPYKPATDALLQLVNNPNLDETLKVGAWIGLKRHVQNGATDPGIATAALAAAAPQASDDDGRLWIRHQSLEILTLLGHQQGPLMLARVMGMEKDAPMWFRLWAASSLTQLQLPTMYIKALPKAVGALGVEAYATAAASVPIDASAMKSARLALASDLDSLSKCLEAAKSKNGPPPGTPPDAAQQQLLAMLDPVRLELADSAKKLRNLDDAALNPTDWVTMLDADRTRLEELLKQP